jgi:hypothetical protein
MIATGNSVLRAWDRAIGRIQMKGVIASEVSAGFLMPLGEKGKGYQVFVKVMKFDRALLKSDPESGGLLINKKYTKGE